MNERLIKKRDELLKEACLDLPGQVGFFYGFAMAIKECRPLLEAVEWYASDSNGQYTKKAKTALKEFIGGDE